MVVFFEGRRVHPLCPTLSWGARGREQLHQTVYVGVVVFFEEPGLRHVTKSYRLDTSRRSEDNEAAAIDFFCEDCWTH